MHANEQLIRRLVVVSVDVTTERDGRRASWRRVVDYRISGDRIVEASVTEGDQDAADTFFARKADRPASMG